jgi:hypothetical protein
MQFDFQRKYLALGNTLGDILIWDMQSTSVKTVTGYIVSHQKSKYAIRMIGFSRCGRIMIGGNEQGQLVRYDLIDHTS